jgi:hypothetical protein
VIDVAEENFKEFTTAEATIVVRVEYDDEVFCPEDLENAIRRILEASDGIKDYSIRVK